MAKIQKYGKVYVDKLFAGIIQKKDGLFSFTYDKNYCLLEAAFPVSLTLPIRTEPYEQKTMIPFFDGLIPEGWMLNILTDNWKVDSKDRMELLLLSCGDCIGNVSIISESGVYEEN